MFDAFPHSEWSDKVTTFWTFGNEGSTGTWILTILGMIVTAIALAWFVMLEKQKLDAQAAKLRAAMGSGATASGTTQTTEG
jgi:hypothetical protein